MLRVITTVMQLCAVLIGCALAIALHALMPGVPLWKALLDFMGLCMAFLFACTLVVSSLLIGSTPARSKLGQRLSGKVDAQTGEARKVYEELRRSKNSSGTKEAQAAMRQHGTKREG